MSPVVLIDQVPRPLDYAGNVEKQTSMDEAVIERVQGQGQMVEQRGDMTVVGQTPHHHT